MKRDNRAFRVGNSLAIRIPSAVAKHAALEESAAVEMAVTALADLIYRITPQNTHEPIFEELTGAERW